MPVQKGPNCVENEMRLFHKGEMRSGSSRKPVTNEKQARAIALSVCGESKYAEVLQSIGYSEKVAADVVALFAEVDWGKEFETGKGPGPRNPQNYEKGPFYGKGAKPLVPKKWQKNNPKVNTEAEMIAPVAYPVQPAGWSYEPTKQVKGLAMLG